MQLIVARARNGVIGSGGALPWRLPEDLAHFRRLTMGHSIVMGRKTWESIGRALPGRRNIVVTRDAQWRAEGALAAHSLEQALEAAVQDGTDLRQVFVIGGAQLYAQALQLPVDTIFLTEIDADFDGDVRFPALEAGRWRECGREHFAPDATRPFGFDFVRYEAVRDPAPSISTGVSDAQ